MQIHETNPKLFKPIHLILESQEEIDTICTLVNSTRITQIFPILDSWLEQISDYGDCEKYIDRLLKTIK